MSAAELQAKPRRAEVWFKVLLLVFFGAVYAVAQSYPPQSRQFPQLIAVISLALVVLALIRDVTAGARGPVATGSADSGDPPADLSRVARAWAIILVGTGLGYLGGFLVSAFAFFVGFAFFFGERRRFWRTTAVAVGISAVIYLLFQTVMGVPLLAGVLW